MSGRFSFFVVFALICEASLAQTLFQDNFDDGDLEGWSVSAGRQRGTTLFDASDGTLYMQDVGNGSPNNTAIVLDGREFTEGIFSFDVTLDNDDTFAGGTFRRTTSDGTSNGYLFALALNPWGNRGAVLTRYDNNIPFTTPATIDINENIWVPGETYRLSAAFNGPALTLSVTELSSGASWSATGEDGVYPVGQVELLTARSFFGGPGPIGARYDNVTVETIPEPSSVTCGLLGCVVLFGFRRRRRKVR